MTSNLELFLLPLVVLIAATALGVVLRLPSVRGGFGEHLVDRALRKGLDGRDYRIFSDLLLPTTDGTTQIDHVVVSRFGVFVIETKNMRGLIVGSVRDAQWTQYRGRRRYPFQNPLRQNYRHAKAVEQALGVSEREIVPLVVFAGHCRFHRNIEGHVTLVEALASTIRRHETPRFSADVVGDLCARIERARVDHRPGARREHVAALKRKHGRTS